MNLSSSSLENPFLIITNKMGLCRNTYYRYQYIHILYLSELDAHMYMTTYGFATDFACISVKVCLCLCLVPIHE